MSPSKGHVSIPHNIVYVGDHYGIIRWSNGRGEGFGLCQFGGNYYVKQIRHAYPYRTFDAAMDALRTIDRTPPLGCACLLFGGPPMLSWPGFVRHNPRHPIEEPERL